LLTVFCLFLCFANLEKNVAPYSVAILSITLTFSSSYFISPLSFLLSFILLGNSGLIASMSIVAFIVTIFAFIYRNKKSRSLAIFCFTILGMLAYLLIGDTYKPIPLEKRIITSAITILLTFLGMIGANALINKGIKFKFAYDEYGHIISANPATKEDFIEVGLPAQDTNYYHTTGSWDGLKYTATANGGAGELSLTLPTTNAVPVMDGTASVGSANYVARSDHKHPTDTSRAPINHASSAGTYGAGTTTYYGHVKISNGDVSTTAHENGLAAGMDHSHGDLSNRITDVETLLTWSKF
jgi:hypothetical protein